MYVLVSIWILGGYYYSGFDDLLATVAILSIATRPLGGGKVHLQCVGRFPLILSSQVGIPPPLPVWGGGVMIDCFTVMHGDGEDG